MDLSEVAYQQGALVALGFVLASVFYFVFYAPLVRARFTKQLNSSKEQFVGLASHYLLTPITIIQTALDRLQQSDPSLSLEERKKLYDAIALGQQRLWIVAEQLVLVNEIDQNQLTPHLKAEDVSEVVSAAIAAVDVFARPKQLTIRFDDATQGTTEARVDARRLKQAIIAVLDNAIKFSMDESRILVRLSASQDLFTLTVEDEGVGMPESVIRRIGEKFYRGSDIYSFDYEGIGLGLHIANAVVRMHQGDISFQSRLKRGTTVTVRFPNQ